MCTWREIVAFYRLGVPPQPVVSRRRTKEPPPLLRAASHDVLRLRRRRGTAVVRKKTSSTGIKPPPPSRFPATVGNKPISCVERCTPRSRARYGRLSARIAVSRRKKRAALKVKPVITTAEAFAVEFSGTLILPKKTVRTSAKQRAAADVSVTQQSRTEKQKLIRTTRLF